MKRPANWYASMCGAAYWAEREPQLARAAEHAIGYEILVQVGREWRASKREASWAM